MTARPDRPEAEGDVPDDDALLDPALGDALIREQRARVESETEIDARLLFGTWGLAWLLGFGVLWAVSTDEPLLDWPIGLALGVFIGLLWVAVVITTVHTARRSAGVTGPSAVQGAMYGWSWFLSFAGIGALAYALNELDVAPATTSTVMTVSSALVVAALYMAGGAIWQVRSQFLLGAWIAVATIAGAIVGYPHMLLVMAVGGGGGMLVGAGVMAMRRGTARAEADR